MFLVIITSTESVWFIRDGEMGGGGGKEGVEGGRDGE